MEEGVDHEGITPAFGAAWWSSVRSSDPHRGQRTAIGSGVPYHLHVPQVSATAPPPSTCTHPRPAS